QLHPALLRVSAMISHYFTRLILRLLLSTPQRQHDMQIATMHCYEAHPRKDKRGVDLISDALPFGRLWYSQPNAVSNAIGYAKHRCQSHDAVIRVYDDAGIVIPLS